MNLNLPKPKVFIETYGCQMNVLDSELIQGQLEDQGYDFTNNLKEASLVLLNTCSVRELSEQKVWSNLGRLAIRKRDHNPNLIIGVLGCMAERVGKNITKRASHVDIVCGPSNLDQLPELIANVRINQNSKQWALSGHNSRRSKTYERAMDGVETLDLSRAFSVSNSGVQAYVRITRGCNKFCSFCVVPYTRGPEVHRSPESILTEIRKLVDEGVIEITLIGQTINHYEYKEATKTTPFFELLHQIHEKIEDLPRLRFVTSYPRDFTDDALDVMKDSKRICRYLHIPAQSGSDKILRSMNRGYSVNEYLELLDRARSRMPDISIAGDMIVGFPNETEEDHEASINFLHKTNYKSCFIFKYSPRSGTLAEKRLEDNVPESVKKIRNIEILNVQRKISEKHHQKLIGKDIQVIVEKLSRIQKDNTSHNNVQISWQKKNTSQNSHVRLMGRTQGDETVVFDGDPSLVGSLTHVRIYDSNPLMLLGQLH